MFIRIGDIIEDKQRPYQQDKPFWTADYLAKKVFDPEIDQSDVSNLYIQSQPIIPTPGFLDKIPNELRHLGEFECLLIDKLLNPHRPVICIYGAMGCGKTTTLNYVAYHIIRDNMTGGFCNKIIYRTIAHIDFEQHILINDLPPSDQTKELYSILCDELWARIRTCKAYNQSLEFSEFWNKGINNYISGKSPSSKAFRKIVSELEELEPIELESLSRKDIIERKDIVDSIKNNNEIYFDYLIELWRYILDEIYENDHSCAFILLDNLDRVAAVVQRQLMRIVRAGSKYGGPSFVLLVRPETFDRIGLGTKIIDVLKHNGPSPLMVVLDRLSRFCNDPESFFDPEASLSRKEFNLLKKYILKLNSHIRKDRYRTFQNFIENSCGSSIRSALLIAQNIFRISIADMEDSDVSTRDIVRTCVKSGEGQLRWDTFSRIEHLFRISDDNISSWLVKPRILKYLGTHNKGRRRLGEIYHTLSGFTYSEELILSALNDLMRIEHQLVRSNGFDFYRDYAALRNDIGQYVMITNSGEGYIRHLVSDVDYLQEIILDTYIEEDRIPSRYSYGYLPEKFRLLYIFLNELRELDCEETSRFIESWTTESYFDSFGQHLLSLDIIQGIYEPSIGILNSGAVKNPQYKNEFDEVIDLFKSLALQVEADNNRYLGIWVESVLSSY